MVCAKCQKTLAKTELATPGVKRKSDIYHGSSTPYTKTKQSSTSTSSSAAAAAGPTGIGKSKLLSKSARNPYAAYSSSCETCKTKVSQGYRYCQRCAYKASNACAMCGKSQIKSAGSTSIVQGAKFSAK